MLVLTKVLIGITIAICMCAGVVVALYFGLNNQKSFKTSSNTDKVNGNGNGNGGEDGDGKTNGSGDGKVNGSGDGKTNGSGNGGEDGNDDSGEDGSGNGEVNENGGEVNENGSTNICTSTKDYEMVSGLRTNYYLTNREGYIRNTDVESIEDCQTLCDDEEDCKMFTFHDYTDTKKYCDLYKNLNSFYYGVDQKFISGIKCTEDCICDGTMIQFNNFESTTPKNLVEDVSGDSYEECMKSCNSNSACKFIMTYLDDDNNFICEGYDTSVPYKNDFGELIGQIDQLSDGDTDTTPYNYAFKKDD